MDQLGKRDIKELNSKLSSLGAEIPKKANVAFEDNFIFIDKELCFFRFRDHVLPSLRKVYSSDSIQKTMKKVTCDMGAVKFVVKGADLMRPGIVSFDRDIAKGEPVLVVDESHFKPIAVGISLFSTSEYSENDAGKAVKILHYVGDAIWKEELPA